MTCRPEGRALPATLGLALLLAACGGAERAPPPPDPAAAIAPLLGKAEAAMASGALGEAARALDAALARAPEDPDLWVAIARLRFRGGEHLTALEAADHALALRPDHAPALLLRALMVRDAHGFAAARPWFVAALAADPDSADAWAEYAASLGDGGEAGAMLAAVRRLAELAPGDPRVFYLQAVLAARAGELGLARSLLDRSGLAARGVPAAVLLDALISLEEGNPDSAAEALAPLAARQPANARLRELLARALLESGRAGEVAARFGPEAALAEASPYLVMVVARAQEQLGNRAAAAPLLARAYGGARPRLAVLAPREGLPQPTMALRAAAARGAQGTLAAEAARLAARFPASADVASLVGDAALAGKDPGGALAAYARAARVKRPWPLTRKAVLAARAQGDEAAALSLLARHVAGEPDGASGLVALAEAEARRGGWRRAALLLDHAIALGAGHDPALLALRRDAARAMGDSEAAARLAARIAEVRPAPLAAR